MMIVEIPNNEEMEPEESTQPPVGEMRPPTHLKFFNPELSLSKGNAGTKVEQRLKERPSIVQFILSIDIKP